ELPEIASCVRAAPDGVHVLTASLGGPDAALQLWRFDQVPEVIAAPSALPSPLAMVDGDPGEAFVYDGSSSPTSSIALLPDGKRCLTSDGSLMRLWNLDSDEIIREYDGHTDKIAGVAVTPDGAKAVTASHDGTLIVWDVESAKQLHKLTVPGPAGKAPVYAVV